MQWRRVDEWTDVELRRELWSSWELTAARRELIASGEIHYYKELRAHIYMLRGSCERKWRSTICRKAGTSASGGLHCCKAGARASGATYGKTGASASGATTRAARRTREAAASASGESEQV